MKRIRLGHKRKTFANFCILLALLALVGVKDSYAGILFVYRNGFKGDVGLTTIKEYSLPTAGVRYYQDGITAAIRGGVLLDQRYLETSLSLDFEEQALASPYISLKAGYARLKGDESPFGGFAIGFRLLTLYAELSPIWYQMNERQGLKKTALTTTVGVNFPLDE